jgi:hypothetical protein
MDFFGLSLLIVGIIVFFAYIAKRDIERMERERNQF